VGSLSETSEGVRDSEINLSAPIFSRLHLLFAGIMRETPLTKMTPFSASQRHPSFIRRLKMVG